MLNHLDQSKKKFFLDIEQYLFYSLPFPPPPKKIVQVMPMGLRGSKLHTFQQFYVYILNTTFEKLTVTLI